jgi:hypothetical protein
MLSQLKVSVGQYSDKGRKQINQDSKVLGFFTNIKYFEDFTRNIQLQIKGIDYNPI